MKPLNAMNTVLLDEHSETKCQIRVAEWPSQMHHSASGTKCSATIDSHFPGASGLVYQGFLITNFFLIYKNNIYF